MFIFGVIVIMLLGACQTNSPQTVNESPADHPHRFLNTRVVGDYHLSMSVDHYIGEIIVMVTDKNERPLKIKEPFIEGYLLEASGRAHKIRFRPMPQTVQGRLFISRRGRIIGPFSSAFVYRAGWLKNVHDFTLNVKVPIKGTIYTASFSYSIPSAENRHHHHYK